MTRFRRVRTCWRERPGFLALSVVVLSLLLVWPLLDTHLMTLDIGTRFRYYDYGAYSGALDRWLSGGDIYVPDEGGGYHKSYLYPPITLLVFLPFRALEFQVAGTLFGGLSLVLLWVALERLAATFGYDLRVWERLLLLWALVGFQPLLFTFKMAQVPTLLAATLCFAYVAMERGVDTSSGRRFLSGALTTLGASMKLFYATAGAHLLRDRRRFLGAMVTAGGLVVASVAIFGVETHLTYLDVLAWGKGWGTDPRSPTLWMPAYYRPMYVLGHLSLPVRVLGVLGVIGLSLAARGSADAKTRRATFALGVAVIPLFAPKAYTQDLVVLLVPAAILLGIELARDGGLPGLPVLAVGLLHVHSVGLAALVDPPTWLGFEGLEPSLAGWVQPGLWGTVLLVGLAARHVAAGSTWRPSISELQ